MYGYGVSSSGFMSLRFKGLGFMGFAAKGLVWCGHEDVEPCCASGTASTAT